MEASRQIILLVAYIAGGELTAYVRDPETGDILQLSRLGWIYEINDLSFAPRDEEGYVAPHTESLIRGEYQPIFVWRDEFEEWFRKTFTRITRRGRKPGSGSMEEMDLPFLKEMHSLLKNHLAKSIEDAARQVVKKGDVPGASPESSITRLARRYRKSVSSERN